MDSMRLWDKLTKESLDKDVYRFNKGDVMATYNRVARRIMTRTARPAATKKKPVAAQRKGAGSPDRAVKSKTKKR
jgi:hypothetical protein